METDASYFKQYSSPITNQIQIQMQTVYRFRPHFNPLLAVSYSFFKHFFDLQSKVTISD